MTVSTEDPTQTSSRTTEAQIGFLAEKATTWWTGQAVATIGSSSGPGRTVS